jgi:hypothetical protein
MLYFMLLNLSYTKLAELIFDKDKDYCKNKYHKIYNF